MTAPSGMAVGGSRAEIVHDHGGRGRLQLSLVRCHLAHAGTLAGWSW